MQLFNDALDDTPVDAGTEGFLGMDSTTKADQLTPEMLRDGLNLWMDGSGIAQTRPGLRLNGFLGDGEVEDSSIQGAGYYDTPSTEELLVVCNGQVFAVHSSDYLAAYNVIPGPTATVGASVKFAQLVDRMFYNDGTLHWLMDSSGWTHGTVTQFANTTAMPTWAQICAHNFRLLAVEAKGHRIYASAVATAHNAADWVQTENIRVGTGEGDPISAMLSGQGANLVVLNLGSVWLVDTTGPSLANWVVRKITDVTGCVEGKTAMAIGQDVLFLSRYGVVSLGALADNISLNPASTLSAPIQPYIDRINWLAIKSAFATVWQELYLLAVPLDEDDRPSVILPYNVRTRRWMCPWEIGSQGLLTGDLEGASAITDEADAFLVDELGAILIDGDGTLVTPIYVVDEDNNALVDEDGAGLVDVGAVSPELESLEYGGISGAVLTRFSGKQETILGDNVGRLLRLDPSIERDDTNPTSNQPIETWGLLKSFTFDYPQHYKQPFSLRVQFEGSTSASCQINLVRSGMRAYPQITLDESEAVVTGLLTGNLTTFPLIFPLVFKPNKTYRRAFHIRDKPRFTEASIQVHSSTGRLRLRSLGISAFIDSPDITR